MEVCKWCKGVDSVAPAFFGFQGLIQFGSMEVTLVCSSCEGTGLSERRLEALKLVQALHQLKENRSGQQS